MTCEQFGRRLFPLLGSVHLDGLTIEDAQSAIEKKLVDGGIMKFPHVTIFVSEYASGVSMLGLVQKPGIYPLLGSRQLYDMISAAGGLSPGAGRLVIVTHKEDPMNPITHTMTSDPKLSAQNNIESEAGRHHRGLEGGRGLRGRRGDAGQWLGDGLGTKSYR